MCTCRHKVGSVSWIGIEQGRKERKERGRGVAAAYGQRHLILTTPESIEGKPCCLRLMIDAQSGLVLLDVSWVFTTLAHRVLGHSLRRIER